MRLPFCIHHIGVLFCWFVFVISDPNRTTPNGNSEHMRFAFWPFVCVKVSKKGVWWTLNALATPNAHVLCKLTLLLFTFYARSLTSPIPSDLQICQNNDFTTVLTKPFFPATVNHVNLVVNKYLSAAIFRFTFVRLVLKFHLCGTNSTTAYFFRCKNLAGNVLWIFSNSHPSIPHKLWFSFNNRASTRLKISKSYHLR